MGGYGYGVFGRFPDLLFVLNSDSIPVNEPILPIQFFDSSFMVRTLRARELSSAPRASRVCPGCLKIFSPSGYRLHVGQRNSRCNWVRMAETRFGPNNSQRPIDALSAQNLRNEKATGGGIEAESGPSHPKFDL